MDKKAQQAKPQKQDKCCNVTINNRFDSDAIVKQLIELNAELKSIHETIKILIPKNAVNFRVSRTSVREQQ